MQPIRETTGVLLDTGALLLGVGLAVAGFIVVVVVSATVLRLIGFVLGDGEAGSADDAPEQGASPSAAGTAGGPGDATPPRDAAPPGDVDSGR